MQYIQDYDETMVPARNCETSACGWWTDSATDWPFAIQPYMKNQYHGASTFHCLSEGWDAYGNWSNNNTDANWSEEFVNYGMNNDYLQPDPGCDPAQTIDGTPMIGHPVNLAAIEAPSDTVLIAETKAEVYHDAGLEFWPSDVAAAPGTLGNNTHACEYWGAWGADSAYDTGPGIPNTSTGIVALRHTNGTNVTFCDGHAKWMTAGSLAAGTNWHVGASEFSVKITDLSKDLWSLKKSGTSDL